jgi:hypothetical protein
VHCVLYLTLAGVFEVLSSGAPLFFDTICSGFRDVKGLLQKVWGVNEAATDIR